MKSLRVQLSDHLNSKKIFLAVIAPICMMVFSSFYSMVDGIFLSNVVGTNAFSGVNLVWPYAMILGSVGLMMGTGGSALVGKFLGEKNTEKASKVFSLVIYTTIVLGVVCAVIGYFTVEPFARWMASLSKENAEEALNFAVRYGRILMLGVPMFMLQNTFQSFFTVAEKPLHGFLFVAGAGIANILLDALFIAGFRMEVEGAALATLIGYFIGGILPILFFVFKKDISFHLGKTELDWNALLKTLGNGSSEFVSNIASSVVSVCYNAQLLIYAGPKGVSAYGIVMYVSFTFMAIFMGYSIGIAPFISYNYGAGNEKELHNIFKRSLITIGVAGLIMFALGEIVGPYFCMGFANSDAELLEISTNSVRIYSFVFLTCGYSIFASSFFTALNNGLVSAIISFVRTVVFEIVCVFVFPLVWGINGVWASAPFAEIGCMIMTVFFFVSMRKKYHY